MKALIVWIETLRYTARHPWVRGVMWATVVAVLVLLAVIGYAWPDYDQHRSLLNAVAAARHEWVASLMADDLGRAYGRALQLIPELEKKLDPASGQSNLVQGLRQLASKYGVKVTGETYQEGKPQGAYLAFPVDLRLEGNYPALRGFISGFADLPMWSEIQEIRLEQEMAEPGLVKGQLRLMLFRVLPGTTRSAL